MNGLATRIVFSILTITTFNSFAESSGSKTYCPSIGAAPRTPHASADQYATSGKFSISKDGIALFDYGESYGGLGNGPTHISTPTTQTHCIETGLIPDAQTAI